MDLGTIMRIKTIDYLIDELSHHENWYMFLEPSGVSFTHQDGKIKVVCDRHEYIRGTLWMTSPRRMEFTPETYRWNDVMDSFLRLADFRLLTELGWIQTNFTSSIEYSNDDNDAVIAFLNDQYDGYSKPFFYLDSYHRIVHFTDDEMAVLLALQIGEEVIKP